MSGSLSKRIRKLMQIKFRTLDVYVKSKKISKSESAEKIKEDLPWTTVYRNVKKLYKSNIKDREFFEILMKKENI